MMPAVRVDMCHQPEVRCHDVLAFLEALPYAPRQHDPRWQRVYDVLPGESFMAAVAHDAGRILGVCTFCVFSGPFGPILHSNPYMGFGGCSCLPERAAETLQALLSAVLAWAKGAGCLTATVALPPFCADLENAYLEAMQPDFHFENFYQYHYLHEHPLQSLKSRSRSTFLAKIRRAARAGVEVVAARTPADLEAWLDIYEARYAEIGAAGPPRDYMRKLWDVFSPSGDAVLQLAKIDESLLGGTLFLIGRGIVDYFASAFDSDSMRLQPGTFLMHRMFTHFVNDGLERFNWQSSPSRSSGVYVYKQRWGAQEASLPILTRVLGDIRPLLARPVDEIRQAYSGHFVVPYRLWETS